MNYFTHNRYIISAAINASSEIAVAFCISICRVKPVSIIEKRDRLNWLTSTATSENCQWVMVYWSVYECVTADTRQRNSIEKHLDMFSI